MANIIAGNLDRVYPKVGDVLVPKPEWMEQYQKMNWTEYVVTEKDVKSGGHVGERWMIKEETK